MDLDLNETDDFWNETWPNDTDSTEPCLRPQGGGDFQVELFEFVILGVLQGICSVIGIIGNVVSFGVWASERKSTSTNFMFRFLAVVDTVFLLIVLLYSIVPTLHGYADVFPGYPQALRAMLPYLWPLLWTVKALAVWTVVMITLDRYQGVCFPIKTRTQNPLLKVKIGCIFLILMVILYNIPHWFEIELVQVWDMCTNSTVNKLNYSALLIQDRMYNIFYVTLGEVIVYFAVPLLVLILCTYRLINALTNAIKARKTMIRGSGKSRNQNSKSVTRMLIAIVIIFIICESPQFIYSVMYFAATVDSTATVYRFLFYNPNNYYYIKLYRAIGDFLFTFQSCVNLFVYCFYGKRFRTILWSCITCANTDELNLPESPEQKTKPPAKAANTVLAASVNPCNDDFDWPPPPTDAELYPMTNGETNSVWLTSQSGQINPTYVYNDVDHGVLEFDTPIDYSLKPEPPEDSRRDSLVVLTGEVVKNWDAEMKLDDIPTARSKFERGLIYLKRLSKRRFQSVDYRARRRSESETPQSQPRSQSLKNRDRDSVDTGYETMERNSNLLELLKSKDFPNGTTFYV